MQQGYITPSWPPNQITYDGDVLWISGITLSNTITDCHIRQKLKKKKNKIQIAIAQSNKTTEGSKNLKYLVSLSAQSTLPIKRLLANYNF